MAVLFAVLFMVLFVVEFVTLMTLSKENPRSRLRVVPALTPKPWQDAPGASVHRMDNCEMLSITFIYIYSKNAGSNRFTIKSSIPIISLLLTNWSMLIAVVANKTSNSSRRLT